MATCSTRPKKYPHTFTAEDRLPEILGTLEGVDLTGYTIEFDLVQPDGTVVQKSTATTGVQFVDAAAGQFKVTWETTDLVVGKSQPAQIRFIDTGGLPLTSQDFVLNVKAKKRP